ncbi:hypothetical protein QBC35DRAFT_516576 [Podospora australis]|uniref:Uncharacterized protein n=1 Tax=Podospora australis TaxID=1536484 RepID=A0AAN6WPV1_9PEZI|nr:hypothetical protein QBC35DRAFT_516576 [Podospora australis]
MLQQQSLDNLIEISRHPVFGPALKNLTICIDHLTDYPEFNHALFYWGDHARCLEEGDVDYAHLGGNLRETDEEPIVDRQAYDLQLENQKFMMEFGLNTTYLAQAMARLPNLETVAVDDAFKPWGATALMRQTGLALTNAIEAFDSVEFVEHVLRALVLAIVASNTSLYELNIVPGHLSGDGISPDMLVFPGPLLRHIRSHPLSLTSLSLSVRPRNRTRPDSEFVTDLLGFIDLFPRLQRLSLEFDPLDQHKHFPEFSQRLRLQNLRFLGLTAVQCTDGELATLLVGHKNTLEEVCFDVVDIIAEGGSWQALLATMRDELSVQVLTMDNCRWGGKEVYYRESENDDATYLDSFETGQTMEDWTDTINNLVIGDGK